MKWIRPHYSGGRKGTYRKRIRKGEQLYLAHLTTIGKDYMLTVWLVNTNFLIESDFIPFLRVNLPAYKVRSVADKILKDCGYKCILLGKNQ